MPDDCPKARISYHLRHLLAAPPWITYGRSFMFRADEILGGFQQERIPSETEATIKSVVSDGFEQRTRTAGVF